MWGRGKWGKQVCQQTQTFIRMTKHKNNKQAQKGQQMAGQSLNINLPKVERIPVVDAYVDELIEKGDAFLDMEFLKVMKEASESKNPSLLDVLLEKYIRAVVEAKAEYIGEKKHLAYVFAAMATIFDHFFAEVFKAGPFSFLSGMYYLDICDDFAKIAETAIKETEEYLLSQERYEDLDILTKTKLTHKYFLAGIWAYYYEFCFRKGWLPYILSRIPVRRLYTVMLQHHDFFEGPDNNDFQGFTSEKVNMYIEAAEALTEEYGLDVYEYSALFLMKLTPPGLSDYVRRSKKQTLK